jgi:alpha-glucoside transport system permease protein
MQAIAGTRSALTWTVHLSVLLLVLLWLFPTVGLFVSSMRSADQIATSGWWQALGPVEQNLIRRAADPDRFGVERDGRLVVEGRLLDTEEQAEIRVWGTSSRAIDRYLPGDIAELGNNETISVDAAGNYLWSGPPARMTGPGQRVFVTATMPPRLSVANYQHMLLDPSNVEGMARAFINTLTVTIPATIIPIVIAAFAAYALAWMAFPGRTLLIAAVVGLLVVPLHLALIPLLKLHLAIGIGKGYLGIWLAHTAFGLPLAIYLLRGYMVGLPRDIIENARVDGATEFHIFTKIILPLSYPALASFAIFQFLWTWNDLLIAKVFLIDATSETTVMTNQIVELLGTRGGNWEILATAAFVSIAVPLGVFFLMQRYLVRGLLAGSVK